ncbi:MAG: right-handed parallel beta-helix repeat-containing protein [Candidatus Hydrogenedentes bacterium]|nr:right-handed parallel beta-helix repeat-containing protein [Candidatus Hydrogenedentota bacterium]
MSVLDDMRTCGRAARFFMTVAVALGLCLGAWAQKPLLVSKNEGVRDAWDEEDGAAYETINEAVTDAFKAGGTVTILVDNSNDNDDPPPVVFQESLDLSCDMLGSTSLDLTIRTVSDSTIGDVVIRSGASGATEPTVVFRPPSGSTSRTLKVTIDGFVIEGGDGGGIRIDGGTCSELLVNGCIVQPETSGNVAGVIGRGSTICTLINSVVRDWGDGGVLAEEDATLSVYNSTIYSNVGDGIQVRDDSTVTVKSTIVYDNDGFGINCDESAATPNITLAINDVYKNTSGEYHRCTPDADSISLDPEFLPGDYHLNDIAPMSPCIDITTDVEIAPWSALDIDRNVRPLTLNGIAPTNFDIGADEAGASPSCSVCVVSVTPNPVGVIGAGEMTIMLDSADTIEDVRMQGSRGSIPLEPTAVTGVWTNSSDITETTPNGLYFIEALCQGNNWNDTSYVCGDCIREVIVDTEPPKLVPSWISPPNPDEEVDCGDWPNSFYVLDTLGTGPGGAGSNDTLKATDLLADVNGWLADPRYYTPKFPPVPVNALPPIIGDAVPRDYDDFDGDGIETWRYWFNTGAMGKSPSQLIVRMAGGAVDLPKKDGATVSAGFDTDTLEGPSGKPIVRQSDLGTSPSSFGGLNVYDSTPGSQAGCTSSAQEIKWTLDFTPAVEGTYKVRLIAEDRAGNISTVEDDWMDCLWATFVWSTSPPRTEITDGCFPELRSTQASFNYHMAGGRAVSYVHILQPYPTDRPRNYASMDPQGVWTADYDQTVGYPNLMPGRTYRFGVLGIDEAGNIDSTLRTEPPVNLCVFEVGAGGGTLDTSITGFVAEIPQTPTAYHQPPPKEYKSSRPPAVIEIDEQASGTSFPATFDVKAQWEHMQKPPQNLIGVTFEYVLEGPGGPVDSGSVVANASPAGIAKTEALNVPISDRAVTYTFTVTASFKDTEGNVHRDHTPATATFTVRPRMLGANQRPGREDRSFADPSSGQPYKYYREEPE